MVVHHDSAAHGVQCRPHGGQRDQSRDKSGGACAGRMRFNSISSATVTTATANPRDWRSILTKLDYAQSRRLASHADALAIVTLRRHIPPVSFVRILVATFSAVCLLMPRAGICAPADADHHSLNSSRACCCDAASACCIDSSRRPNQTEPDMPGTSLAGPISPTPPTQSGGVAVLQPDRRASFSTPSDFVRRTSPPRILFCSLLI
jgi:hypothetical protein